MPSPARSTSILLAAVVALAPLLAACGEEEGAGGGGTTHTTAVVVPCDEVYTEGDGSDELPEDVAERGQPVMEPCGRGSVEELMVIDDHVGSGDEVAEGATITAHYVGIVARTGDKFDSSWDRGEPATFPLDGVIQGWSEGLVGMKVGGRRTLVIPAEMAYGANPPPGSGIPVNAALVFTVDLVSVS